MGALLLSFVGAVLSLGPLDGAIDPVAVAFGVGAALFSTAYILVGNHNGASVSSLTMTALVLSSATASYAVTGSLAGTLALPSAGRTWAYLGVIGTVCTAVAIVFFFLAMERIGPTMASLASALEPVGAVIGGALVIGTR